MSIKHFFSYIISLIFVVIALIFVSGGTARLLEQGTLGEVSPGMIILVICAVAGFYAMIVEVAKGFRSSPEKISIFGLNFTNPVYDPVFEELTPEDQEASRSELKKLKDQHAELEGFTALLLDELEAKDIELEDIQYITETYIRHHTNSSRLIRSLTSLIDEDRPGWVREFYSNVLDECTTVLHQDRADKSSALYIENQGRLEMAAYYRINSPPERAEASDYGGSFAGTIWHTGEVGLVPDIVESDWFKEGDSPGNDHGSIIGLPVKINQSVVGVLCIQSERTDGFIEEDIKTLEFYADICALAYYCANISVNSDTG